MRTMAGPISRLSNRIKNSVGLVFWPKLMNLEFDDHLCSGVILITGAGVRFGFAYSLNRL